MTVEKPYECDTSRYYQPYKDNGKCICNKNLVEINGFCLCDERLGFKLHQENDNCECTKQGKFQFLSTSGRCVQCDDKNGQVIGKEGICVCGERQIALSTNPLECYMCDQDQYLKDNKCYCEETEKEGPCKMNQGISIAQISIIGILVCSFIMILIVIEKRIHKRKLQKKAQQKYHQMNQKVVQIVPVYRIRRNQLII
ncbi:Hypothetical_protein [Hexamita inflata]|uniref:Hypothetical_protein n=1 Tax=Hexamita inflata TaxID=28002 RepID=A0AA86VF17_9EUKA|nr:Hypothetical protein HINF_LOCUS52428 [Hexamita inflata]